MFDIHFMYVVILASCLVDLSRLRVIQSPNGLVGHVSGKACSKRFVVNVPAVKVELRSTLVLTPNLSNNDTCGTPHVTHLLGGEPGYFIWFDPEC